MQGHKYTEKFSRMNEDLMSKYSTPPKTEMHDIFQRIDRNLNQ